MGWPTPDDYDDASQNLRHSMGDEELRVGQAALDDQQLPMVWAGNFAHVYKIHCPHTGNTWALKCFTKDIRGRVDRYARIAECLKLVRLPFAVPFEYLEQGVKVRGEWFPALKMQWVEGQPLNSFVEASLGKRAMLEQLLDWWPRLAARVREAGIAHADLQHGNVLLVPMANGQLAIRLIDYDGMYVPSLAGRQSGELGHPAYQHPQRIREGTYSADLDRFSHLVIYTAVHCLKSRGRDLWRQFNNDDNLLFRQADFRQPGASTIFQSLWNLGDEQARAMAGRLILACRQRLEEAPWLDQIVEDGRVKSLTHREQQGIASLMAVGKAAMQSKMAASTAVTAAAPEFPVQPLTPTVLNDAEPIRDLFQQAELVEEILPEPILLEPDSFTVEELLRRCVTAVARGLDRLFTVGKSLPRRLTAAARGLDTLLRRLVGAENDILRYFLWAVLPVLLCVAVWAGVGALTPSPVLWKLRPVSSQTVEAGKALTVAVSVDNASVWRGKVRYSLNPLRATGARIDSLTGELTWTPPPDLVPGDYSMMVRAQGPDGQTEQISFRITVTRPTPSKAVRDEISVDLGGGVKLEMVLIPAASFMMGDTEDNDATPVHMVTITKPFYLGKYEVTQEQWEAVVGNNPSRFKGPKNPVEQVSWDDCQGFLVKLNALTAGQGGEFAMPTEAQWEYACRAESTTEYCLEDDKSQLGKHGWYQNNSVAKTYPVGEKKPNAWGLFDMYGNVWEKCADWYDSGYYAKSPAYDPRGPSTGSFRVDRGGGWNSPARHCRSAYRDISGPRDRNDLLGLRVCRVVAELPRGSPEVLRLQPIPPQSIEAGNLLSIAVSVENADQWKGKLRFGVGASAPARAAIDTTGKFTWTPPLNQTAGNYDVEISVEGSEGQKDQTTLAITVIRPNAVARSELASKPKEISLDVAPGVKLEMVLIPAGSFMMGDTEGNDATPVHMVTITKPFYLGKYEVTQKQWEAVMGSNPSRFKDSTNPVEQVSWDDCQGFLVKLNALTAEQGGEFAMPTEAQWEYACRAGSTTRYCYGDDPSELDAYAWYGANSDRTHPVGKKKPNAWGLYDMHGNVWEWCADWYDAAYYANSPTHDATGPDSGTSRVLRGGSWRLDYPVYFRCAYRYNLPPVSRNLDGFRVARTMIHVAAEPAPAASVPGSGLPVIDGELDVQSASDPSADNRRSARIKLTVCSTAGAAMPSWFSQKCNVTCVLTWHRKSGPEIQSVPDVLKKSAFLDVPEETSRIDVRFDFFSKLNGWRDGDFPRIATTSGLSVDRVEGGKQYALQFQIAKEGMDKLEGILVPREGR